MKISKQGLDFIKGFESFVPFIYDDLKPVRGKYGYAEWTGGKPKGTLTIGYGHTADALAKVDMSQGKRITESEACTILDKDLDEIENSVNTLVKVPISQGQFDALVSFGFNCGIGNLKKLIVPLNKGDYDGTKNKFSEFIRSKGQVLNGLVRRRKGEQELWQRGSSKDIPQDEPVETPKGVSKVPDPISSNEKIVGIVATVAPVASSFSDWKIAAVVLTAVVIGGIAYLWFRNR